MQYGYMGFSNCGVAIFTVLVLVPESDFTHCNTHCNTHYNTHCNTHCDTAILGWLLSQSSC